MKKQGITVVGSNPIQSMDGSNPCQLCDGNTRSHGNPHVSAPISCSLPDQYATWAYISIPRLPRPKFLELCRAVSTYSRQIRSAHRSVTRPVLQSLVVSLVLSRLDYGNAALAGLPGRDLSRLQSVQNAGARLIFSANKYDHVSSLLRDLLWLRAPQRMDYKIAVLVYRCLRGLAPAYLSVDLQSMKDLLSRKRLRSWSSDTLAVPTSNLSAVGDRAFPIAAARVWNTLSPDVRSSSSLSTFKRRLKTELFSRSFPD